MRFLAYPVVAFTLILSLILPPSLLLGQETGVIEDEVPLEEVLERRNKLIQDGFLQDDVTPYSFQSAGSASLLSDAEYTGKRLSVSTEGSRASDFRPDGSRFYILGRSTENVEEYHLSSNWDITSASLKRDYDFSSEMGSAAQGSSVTNGLYIRKDDGKRMWIFNRTEIWEYTLSSAWDVSTASQSGYRDLSSDVVRGHDIDFRPNGRVLYVDDRSLGVVFQYSLSTAWDIDTATLDYVYDISDQQEEVRGIQFDPDGDKMFLMDTAKRRILEYNVSTSYDLRSASYKSSFSVGSQSSDPRGMTFNSDFSRFYITDATGNRVYQYQISLPPDAAASSISASQSKVQANGQNSSRITVTVRDKDGRRLEGVRTELRAAKGTLQVSPSSRNTDSNGEARFEVTNSKVEQVDYEAVAGGVKLQSTVSVNFMGIDAELSSINSSKKRILADGKEQAEIIVTARDEDNETFSNLSMDLLADGGNSTIQAVRRTTNSAGEALFRVSGETRETVTYSARGLGTTLNKTVTITFIGVDPELSSIGLSKPRIQANGSDQAEITIHARDQDNEPISNLTVDLLSDGGNSTIEAVRKTTDDEGIAIFRVSGNQPETVTYRARGMGTTLSDRVSVEFLGIDAELSTVRVSDDHIQANGDDFAEITITARDEDNEPFNNLNMELLADGGNSTIEIIQGKTDSDGVSIFRVSSQIPETVIYRARGLGTTLASTATINFIPVAPVSLSATGVETRSFTANWELVNGAGSYRLDVATDSSSTTFLSGYEDRNVGEVTSHVIENVLPGTTYFYRVRAAVGDLIGADSDLIEVTTFPDIPVASDASNRNALTFTARWEPAEGARKYRLDISTDPDFAEPVSGYEDLDVGNQVSYDADGLEPGTSYYYRVRSEAGPRTSGNSNIISTSTLAISPELSSIEQEQLRILADGNQKNEVTILVKSDEGVALKDLTVSLTPENGHSEIKPVQAQTDEEGLAVFELSNLTAETVSYLVDANGIEIGSFNVEFLPNDGVLNLGNNYPNPFKDKTTLPLTVPDPVNVQIKIFDLLGKPVQTVMNENLEPGHYEVPFLNHGLAAGVYFYRLTTGNKVITKRMVLVR